VPTDVAQPDKVDALAEQTLSRYTIAMNRRLQTAPPESGRAPQ
jgi:hypothetical protein